MEKVYRLIITGPDTQGYEDYNDQEAAIADADEAFERPEVDSVMVVETTIDEDGSESYDIVYERNTEFEDKLAGEEPEGFDVDDEEPVFDEEEPIAGEEEFEESLNEAEEEKKEYDFDEDSAYNDRDYDEEEYYPAEEVAEDDFELPEDTFADDPDYAKQEIEQSYPEEASNEETIWVYQFPAEFNVDRVIEDAKNFNLEEVPSEGDDDDICFKGKYSDLKAFSSSYQYLMNADYLVPEQWFSGERLAY